MKVAHVLPVSTNKNRINNIRKSLTANLHNDTQLDIITYDNGPKDLEYYIDDHKAINLMMDDHVRLNSYDAISIACFYDPGIRELREILSIPVIGISQASILLAQVYGHKTSIIISRYKNLPKMEDNMKIYGFADKISSWKSLNMTVQDLQTKNKTELLDASAELTKEAIHQDNAEVIILGCGALSGLENALYEKFNIPIINPIVAGIKLAETLASLKQTSQLTTSKMNDYESKN